MNDRISDSLCFNILHVVVSLILFYFLFVSVGDLGKALCFMLIVWSLSGPVGILKDSVELMKAYTWFCVVTMFAWVVRASYAYSQITVGTVDAAGIFLFVIITLMPLSVLACQLYLTTDIIKSLKEKSPYNILNQVPPPYKTFEEP